MRRSTMLAALLLAALFAAGDAQPLPAACPIPSPVSWYLAPGSSVPCPSFCNTTTIYTQFEWWTPELTGSTLSSGSGSQLSPSSIFSNGPVVARDSSGNVIPNTALTCQFVANQLSTYPGLSCPTTATPVQTFRTCGNITTANAATLPAGTPIRNTTLSLATDCCKLCTNTVECRQWAYLSTNATAVNATCLLYGAFTSIPVNNTGSYIVGRSAGWGTGWFVCQALGGGSGDLASISFNMSGAYTQQCNGTFSTPISSVNGFTTIPITPAVDAPSANLTALTVPTVCAGAPSVSGTFVYTGTNVIGTATFNVTLPGATCTAASVPGTSVGTPVTYTCTVPAPGIPAGPFNVTVVASFSGSSTGRCAGVKTATLTGTGSAAAAPTASFGAAPVVTPVCTGFTPLVTTFSYNSSAANTTFTATSIPASTCTATPLSSTGGPTSVIVSCNRTGGFPTGTTTIVLSASYVGSNSPCSAAPATVISQNTTVTITPAHSGESIVPVTNPAVCAPASSVAASFRFNITNAGAVSFTASSPGLSCQALPSSAAGLANQTISTVVAVTCNSTTPLAASTVPITLTANWAGQGTCAGGSLSGNTTVVVEPTPSVTVTPVTPVAPSCYGATIVKEDFRVVVANGAGPTTFSAKLAGVFNCSVVNPSLPGNGTVTVTCTNPSGFPSGQHALVLTATTAGPPGACAGSYTSTGTTTITVVNEPVLTITPVRVDEPLCAGVPSVTVTWTYRVTGDAPLPNVTTATSIDATGGLNCTTVSVVGTALSGTVTAVCFNLPTTDASVDMTLTMATTQPTCGTTTASATNTYTVACCLYNATAYAKMSDNNPNPPFCYRHQRPNNVQSRNCPFYYGWFNQGPTTSDTTDVDSASKVVAMQDPSAAGCAVVTDVADVTALCEGPLPPPNSQGSNVLRVTVLGYKYSSARTFVYAGCPRVRDGPIPLSNSTCTNTANTWKPFTWAHYGPGKVLDPSQVPAGRAGLQFRIPIARTGPCTCDNIYWTVVTVGNFKGVPCPAP